MTQRVVIVQEYIPTYRRPFFDSLRLIAGNEGWDLKVVAGEPRGAQAARGDASSGADVHARTVRLHVGRRRLELRRLPHEIRDADLVIYEQARRNLDAHLALRSPRRKVGLWGHGFDHSPGVSPRDEALLRGMTLRADWFFGYTAAGVDHVVSYGYPAARATVVNNSTDTTSLRAQLAKVTSSDIAGLRGPASPDAQFVAYVGALDVTKRIEFLIEASELVARDVPAFRLLVVGDGPASASISQRVADRPWARVMGRLEGRELAVVLRTSSAIACPGAVGLVAVDALTAGVPIVTTDWPYHGPERAYLSRSNSITTDNSIEAYAQGLTRVLQDRPLRLALAEQGKRDSRRYSVEQMASAFGEGIGRALAS